RGGLAASIISGRAEGISPQSQAFSAMSRRAPKATTESESKSSPDGRADSGKGNEPPGSDELTGASRGGGTEGAEPPSSGGLADASRCSDTKGKEACVMEEA
ncbi:unnamed protein product, partial [Urochloa humidicola]